MTRPASAAATPTPEARLLTIVSPAGFEGFEPATTNDLPTPGPPNMQRLALLAEQYGCEFVTLDTDVDQRST